MAEEKVVCPTNLRWLKGVYDFLGHELFMRSKLAKYFKCIEHLVRTE